jgi:hypothetical protein
MSECVPWRGTHLLQHPAQGPRRRKAALQVETHLGTGRRDRTATHERGPVLDMGPGERMVENVR